MKLRDDHDVLEAIQHSRLRGLPNVLSDRLIETALVRKVPAGTSIHREGDPPFLDLVMDGLIRMFVASPNGRSATIHYFRAGDLIGVATLFNQRTSGTHTNMVALVDSQLISLQPATVRTLAEQDVRVARALLEQVSVRVAEFIDELEANSFATLRQRLSRHLLDLAAEQQVGPRLVARASQEELAGAIGTVREIVVRVLREMRDEGVVRTGRGAVELLDPARLDAETYGRKSF